MFWISNRLLWVDGLGDLATKLACSDGYGKRRGPVLLEACFLLGRTQRGPAPVIELLRRGALAVGFKLADET